MYNINSSTHRMGSPIDIFLNFIFELGKCIALNIPLAGAIPVMASYPFCTVTGWPIMEGLIVGLSGYLDVRKYQLKSHHTFYISLMGSLAF